MKITSKKEKAIQTVQKEFPFKGYIQSTEAHLGIAKTILRWLRPGAKILDFGAGPADKTAVLSLLGFKCTACDNLQDDWHKIEGNREKIFAFSQKFGIRYEMIKDRELPFKKGEFDMVMLHDVLEHLHNSPRDLLNDLLEFVKPEGYLFITVPNAVNLRKRIAVIFGRTNLPNFESYYWYPGFWRGHIREYVKDDLAKLAKFLNLDILELRSCHHMLGTKPAFTRFVFVVLTFFFRGWRDSWLLVARKKPNWKPKKSLSKDELNRILGRFTTYQY